MTLDEYIEARRQQYATLLDAIGEGAPDLLPLIVDQWIREWQAAEEHLAITA
jgi:hypothetical protein